MVERNIRKTGNVFFEINRTDSGLEWFSSMRLEGEEIVSFEDRNFFHKLVNLLYLKATFWPRKTLDKGSATKLSRDPLEFSFVFCPVSKPRHLSQEHPALS